MKQGEFRQGERHPLTLPADMRHDGFVQHFKDRRPPISKERAAELKRKAEAATKKKAADQEKHEKAWEARRERQRTGTPGGPAQTGSADEARVVMIDRHKEPGEGPKYVTPGEAFDTFTREPYGLEGAAQAHARMIERQEKRDGDKSRSLARRSPHEDGKEDPLISAALRDVREAFTMRQKPAKARGAAESARAAMIRRKTGQP